MKMKDVDFETYLKNYPTKNGYFGKYGGCYVSKELQAAFDEIDKHIKLFVILLNLLVN